MPIQIARNLRVKLPSGNFEFAQSEFVVLECSEMPRKSVLEPELFMPRHVRLMSNMVEQDSVMCLWVAECPTQQACKDLKQKLPDAEILNCSVAGYFSPTAESVGKFWGVFEESFKKEPWNNETAWMLCGVRAKLPPPQKRLMKLAVWDHSYVLEHINDIDSIFAQMGWFSYIAVRSNSHSLHLLSSEFEEVDRHKLAQQSRRLE